MKSGNQFEELECVPSIVIEEFAGAFCNGLSQLLQELGFVSYEGGAAGAYTSADDDY